MDYNKLWPVEQLLQWLHNCNTKKFCAIPNVALPTLLALAKYADNDTWKCHPSYATLANVTMKHRTKIIEHVKLLESANIIKIEKSNNASNKYTICTENLWKDGAICKVIHKITKKVVAKRYPPSSETLPPQSRFATRTTHLTTHLNKKNGFVEKKMNNEMHSVVQEWGPGHPSWDNLYGEK